MTRMTRIYADFSDVELTYFFTKNEHYLICIRSKAEKSAQIRVIRVIRVAIYPYEREARKSSSRSTNLLKKNNPTIRIPMGTSEK